jgi:hypothetical protein
LSSGELIDRAAFAARSRFWSLIRPAAPIYLTAGGIILLLSTANPWARYALAPATALVAAFCECLTIAAAYLLVEGHSPTSRSVWALLKPRLGASILGHVARWLFITLGLVLFIVPGLYLACLYFAVPTVSITEKAGFLDARKRSRQLSQPHLRRVFLSFGLPELGIVATTLIVGYTLRWLYPSTPDYAIDIVSWVIGFAILPFKGMLRVRVYLDCRVRSEGYDLERTLDHATAAV